MILKNVESLEGVAFKCPSSPDENTFEAGVLFILEKLDALPELEVTPYESSIVDKDGNIKPYKGFYISEKVKLNEDIIKNE